MKALIIDIDTAILKLDSDYSLFKNNLDTTFWRQCIRDGDGRWQEYSSVMSMENTKYFHGHQPRINYQNSKERKYLKVNFEVRRMIYESFKSGVAMDVPQFETWLKDLRDIMSYRFTEEWKLDVHATRTHTKIVNELVVPIANELNDPYDGIETKGPVFELFPIESLPTDERDGSYIVHTYPSLEHAHVYFDEALKTLQGLLSQSYSEREYIFQVAYFYQVLINLHYFPSINTSLYMNIANALLEIVGIGGVGHGIKDFVAMRLQPINYQHFFYDEVTS